MTSAGEAAGSPPLPAAVGGHRRSPLDRLPPPANTTKPLTPFGIEDILGRPRGGSPPGTGTGPAAPPAPAGPRGGGGCAPASPLWALEELASKTFQGLELGMLQAAGGVSAAGRPEKPPVLDRDTGDTRQPQSEGREKSRGRTQGTGENPGSGPSPPGASGPRPPCRKRRKSRTAFTAQQLRELEQRFRRQRYLSPVDRDALAARLALSAAQVITWFQNRRAKLKRDLEELRADVASLQALPPAALQQLAGLPEPPGAPGTGTGTAEPAELSEEEIDVAD